MKNFIIVMMSLTILVMLYQALEDPRLKNISSNVKTITTTDTITVTDTVKYAKLVPIYIKERHIDTVYLTKYDTIRIVNDYMSVKHYEEKLIFDTLGFANLSIDITNNSIKSLEYTYSIFKPVIHSVKTIKEYNHRYFAGVRIGEDVFEPVFGIQSKRIIWSFGINMSDLKNITPSLGIFYRFN